MRRTTKSAPRAIGQDDVNLQVAVAGHVIGKDVADADHV
jgi:hypothetical protein